MGSDVHALRALARAPDAEIDLGLGAFLIAQVEHPRVVPFHELKRLDELAARCGASAADDPLRALHRLREFLFADEGFRGNREHYYDPRNSCLNDVLDRKLGIPITLSVLCMEVGRRVGLRIDGIGLPGHFVVSAHVGGERVLLDPFEGGSVLTEERAATLATRAMGREVRLTEEHWAPATRRQILTRMLLNLRGIYARSVDWPKALAVLDRLVLLDESSPVHFRDRGTVLVKLGELFRGAADWQGYLARCPHAEDAENVREQLRKIRTRLAALN
jgi:regulator of sirC expression with transglutaminase-like and TPR domain